ncbi:MAG: class I SAM-dependent methyltransferase [Planctomycetales bacterium]|nr:class I SAM-dependent methyltransferase [Planctomycetales bacterium]
MSTDLPDYELLDFGDGRKLERFGPWVLDRPCPGAEEKKQLPNLWGDAIACFEGDRAADGIWVTTSKNWQTAQIDFPLSLSEQCRFQLQLAPLPSGQIGIFFEQFANWQWIVRQIDRAKKTVNVLNLFAYTGGSTLAAASAGAQVTHVDASKSMVARARENAVRSDLADAPIRWIVEDALKFCQREVKRGNQYDAVILDPPSYGHGPQGQRWLIQHDLLPLLELCGELTSERRVFILGTCHTPGIGAAELSAYLADGIFGHCGQLSNSGKLYLQTRDGRKLPSGAFARWPA